MWARSIFTAFVLSLTTIPVWAQTVPAAPGPASGPNWRPAGYGADNAVVPATATTPGPLSPAAPTNLSTSTPPEGNSAMNTLETGTARA